MSDLYDREHYEGKEGATLTVNVDENTTAELTQVEYEDTSDEQIDGFSVLFEGPADAVFDQGLHDIEHSEAGEGELFLVPIISQDPEKRKYELTVSKLKEGIEEGGGEA